MCVCYLYIHIAPERNMYGETAYEHALRGETLNGIVKILKALHDNETTVNKIEDLLYESGYMEGDDE